MTGSLILKSVHRTVHGTGATIRLPPELVVESGSSPPAGCMQHQSPCATWSARPRAKMRSWACFRSCLSLGTHRSDLVSRDEQHHDVHDDLPRWDFSRCGDPSVEASGVPGEKVLFIC